MTVHTPLHTALWLALALTAGAAGAAEPAKPAAPKPAAAKAQPSKPVAKAAAKPVALPDPAPATAEQLEAAKLVYTGVSDCEFKQNIRIDESEKFPGYMVLRWEKATYTMKPVLSTTGAMRLEDVHGQTLLIQIGNKSMLMNVKAGQRLVDDCIHPKQREAIEAARANPGATTALLVAPDAPQK
ncbi:hypothetical protein [Aquabacterium sp. J223]|uniref:hypothetical protein n=1 Tax=Aquabacterium sp. J223 TaxID=2898431 RepID=UPI0021AD841C|nr:hypothetical protein [Aquabacterium sp. J223]UUX94650.1 hypothetical protein LRS07_15305 [Aquabacterium sp. J223]